MLALHPKFTLVHCQRVEPPMPIRCLLNLFLPTMSIGFPNSDTPNLICSKIKVTF